ncbi:MAG: CBS domain-containing protein [Acidimicrobiales bacterium]|nr:CBS domain-containing protein [Acidimicrobiales bacterium]MCB1261690.1 CBS domain-containing protein [Acidimicrobiales bacterium]
MTTIQDLMTTDLCALSPQATLAEAAGTMRDRDVGDVLVIDDAGELRGIVTDRDITVRATADGRDPTATQLGDVCTDALVTVAVDDAVDDAVRSMREHAVRRLPVVDDDGTPIGMISIGDLARSEDPSSALADISADAPNN